MSAGTTRVPPALWAGAAALAALLVATSVPGVFTIDESNYLVTVTGLRAGRLTVPGTEGLTPSNELAFFDPKPWARAIPRSPVGSTAPPLYSVIALPFSFFGWRGLVAVNALAWLLSGLLVFALASRFARERRTPWIALGTYLLGGYGLEYAQGVWPHALAACLATAGFLFASRARDGEMAFALLAGVALGFATGVRYQNLVFAGSVAVALLLWGERRVLATALFASGYAPLLLACSYANHVRLGSWNPISKGPGYLSVGPGRSLGTIVTEAFHVFYAKVVDYAANPAPFDPKARAFVFFGAVKKSWLQSSPWLALALIGLLLAWKRTAPSETTRGAARETRAASLTIALTLASFAVAGFSREDGICFNQRYFIELVPIGAAVFAWSLEGRALAARPAVLGAAAALAVGGLLLLLDPATGLRHQLEYGVPLAIAALLLLSFVLRAPRRGWALPAAAAAAVSWAAVIHVGEDVPTTRAWRTSNARKLRDLDARLPRGAPEALLAFRPWPDTFGPLLLNRDLVIVDGKIDDGRTLVPITRELLAKGRRVHLLALDMPKEIGAELSRTFRVTLPAESRPIPLFEVAPR